MRTEYALPANVVSEKSVGRFIVQLISSHAPPDKESGFCYRVLLDGRKVRCWTDSDERVFPKKAARTGSEMVKRAIMEGPQGIEP